MSGTSSPSLHKSNGILSMGTASLPLCACFFAYSELLSFRAVAENCRKTPQSWWSIISSPLKSHELIIIVLDWYSHFWRKPWNLATQLGLSQDIGGSPWMYPFGTPLETQPPQTDIWSSFQQYPRVIRYCNQKSSIERDDIPFLASWCFIDFPRIISIAEILVSSVARINSCGWSAGNLVTVAPDAGRAAWPQLSISPRNSWGGSGSNFGCQEKKSWMVHLRRLVSVCEDCKVPASCELMRFARLMGGSCGPKIIQPPMEPQTSDEEFFKIVSLLGKTKGWQNTGLNYWDILWKEKTLNHQRSMDSCQLGEHIWHHLTCVRVFSYKWGCEQQEIHQSFWAMSQ